MYVRACVFLDQAGRSVCPHGYEHPSTTCHPGVRVSADGERERAFRKSSTYPVYVLKKKRVRKLAGKNKWFKEEKEGKKKTIIKQHPF